VCAMAPRYRRTGRGQEDWGQRARGAVRRSVSFGRFARDAGDVVGDGRCDVLRAPVDADALRQPRQCRIQQCVPLDVDLFAASKTPFEILGQNTGGTEPPDQLPARFRTQFSATLIDQDGGCDVAETPSDAETTVSVGQGLRAVRQLVAGIVLPPRDPTANRPLFSGLRVTVRSGIKYTHGRKSCSETAIPARGAESGRQQKATEMDFGRSGGL